MNIYTCVYVVYLYVYKYICSVSIFMTTQCKSATQIVLYEGEVPDAMRI